MQIVIYIASSVCEAAGLVIAFWYVLRSGRVVKGLFIGWGLSIVGIFLASVVFPGLVSVYNSEYCQYFPEAIGVGAVMFLGWMPASVTAVLAGIIRYGARRWTKSDKVM